MKVNYDNHQQTLPLQFLRITARLY